MKKWIESYENQYLADAEGTIFSVNRRTNLKFTKTPAGYYSVNLAKGKKFKTFLVHRLIAQTFIPNPKNKRTVNHINGIRTDNRIENLEWMTYSENHIHAYRVLGRKKFDNRHFGKRNKNLKGIIQYDLNGNEVRRFNHVKEVWEELGLHKGSIIDCCNCKPCHKTFHGFIWKYAS